MNPNAFVEAVIKDESGMPVKQGDIHIALQQALDIESFAVILFPREHAKTTQGVIARAAWEIGRNPNIRIKIVCNSDNVAISRVKAIREIIETPLYRSIFPNIQPGRDWTDSKFTVDRTVSGMADATCEGFGVLSKVTGGRCDLLLLDDPDDAEVVESEAKRVKNVERIKNTWLNLLASNGRAYLFATPWHEKDIAHYLMAKWPTLRFPIVDMEPVWPERWPRARLMDKKNNIGTTAFARGYELICVSPENALIKGIWFNAWKELPELVCVAVAVDLAISERETADYTVIGVGGIDANGRVYLLDIAREHLDFPSTLNAIRQTAAAAHARYGKPPYIGIESVAYQKAVPQELKRTSQYPIIELKADKSKHMRAERLSVHIENGRVFLRSDGNGGFSREHQIVYDECVNFPASAHDDCVDMLGYLTELLLQKGTGAAFQPRIEEREETKYLDTFSYGGATF